MEICSEEIRSGYVAGRAATKVKKSLNKLGISKTNACNWIYKSGTSQTNSVREAIINIKNVSISDIFLLTLKDSIFFWTPTRRYATTILIKKGVKTDPKNMNITKVNIINTEKIMVSSLLKIFLKKLFNCSIIFYFYKFFIETLHT